MSQSHCQRRSRASNNYQQHSREFASNALKRTTSRFAKVETRPRDPWIERALQKDFPPIRIIAAEESSESSETIEEEMQETARETEKKNSILKLPTKE
jgi:hypothetical protein